MARLSLLTLHERKDLDECLAEAGFTVEMAREVCRRPELAMRMVAVVNTHLRARLVHGMYTPTEDLFDAFKWRCRRNPDLHFSKLNRLKWKGSDKPPVTDDPDVATVLDVSLDTLQSTVRFALNWLQDVHKEFYKSEDIVVDDRMMRLVDGATFLPWTLRWRTVRLNVHRGAAPGDVRDPSLSPATAGLLLAAQHPYRMRCIDNLTRCGFWLPGFMCTAPGGGPWKLTPRLTYNVIEKRVLLEAAWCGESSEQHVVPVFAS